MRVSHLRSVHREKLLPSHAHGELVVVHAAPQPSQREPAPSSCPEEQRGCNRPPTASIDAFPSSWWRLRSPSATRIYCGVSHSCGSSSSASTRGVGRDSGELNPFSPSVIAN